MGKSVIVIPLGQHTTYDFASKSFGHATMMVSPWSCEDMDEALKGIQEARKRLSRELKKKDRGEPYDFFFVHGFHEGEMEIYTP